MRPLVVILHLDFRIGQKVVPLVVRIRDGQLGRDKIESRRALSLIETILLRLVLVLFAGKTTSLSSKRMPLLRSLLHSDGRIPQNRFSTRRGRISECRFQQNFSNCLHSLTVKIFGSNGSTLIFSRLITGFSFTIFLRMHQPKKL